jgi:hypothetical protein
MNLCLLSIRLIAAASLLCLTLSLEAVAQVASFREYAKPVEGSDANAPSRPMSADRQRIQRMPRVQQPAFREYQAPVPSPTQHMPAPPRPTRIERPQPVRPVRIPSFREYQPPAAIQHRSTARILQDYVTRWGMTQTGKVARLRHGLVDVGTATIVDQASGLAGLSPLESKLFDFGVKKPIQDHIDRQTYYGHDGIHYADPSVTIDMEFESAYTPAKNTLEQRATGSITEHYNRTPAPRKLDNFRRFEPR